ncbi:MAG TPA: flagellar biosynthesis protein FlhA, partial [Clostridia bacterium]|nr:flagellar biosynthesis protein FlhA [Clostridia bacterium]
VSQIPALLVSTATGIIVTRNSSEANMGYDLSKQLTSQPLVMLLAGFALFIINFIPGLPHIPILIISAALIYFGFIMLKTPKKQADETSISKTAATEASDKTQTVYSYLQVDPIELEFGYSVIPLADVNQGGDLLERVVAIRKQCAMDLGVVIPVIRLRDDLQLNPGEYSIKIKGIEAARGEIIADHYLAMNPSGETMDMPGIDTTEPTFGLPARWITPDNRDRAEIMGYTVVDPATVIATHLAEVLKKHSYEFIGRQDLHTMLEHVRQSAPALVDEVTPKLLTLGEIQKVLMNLLKEGIPIRDMATILEVLGDYGALTRDTDLLTEYVRQGLKRTISKKFVSSGRIHAITVDPNTEDIILKGIQQSQQGSYLAIPPEQAQTLLGNLSREAMRVSAMGYEPVVVTSPVVRIHLKKLSEHILPDLVVLSFQEIEQNVEIHGVGTVSI